MLGIVIFRFMFSHISVSLKLACIWQCINYIYWIDSACLSWWHIKYWCIFQLMLSPIQLNINMGKMSDDIIRGGKCDSLSTL